MGCPGSCCKGPGAGKQGMISWFQAGIPHASPEIKPDGTGDWGRVHGGTLARRTVMLQIGERVKPVPLMLKDIYGRLLERGHKLTPQRWAIISIFLVNKGRHLSADDVYTMLKEAYPNNGIATVYRTLDLLEEIGVLKKLDFGDGRARYEVADDDTHHHHHLVCTCCGKITEFEDDLLDSVETTIERKTGFSIRDHVLKFYGLCANCQAKGK